MVVCRLEIPTPQPFSWTSTARCIHDPAPPFFGSTLPHDHLFRRSAGRNIVKGCGVWSGVWRGVKHLDVLVIRAKEGTIEVGRRWSDKRAGSHGK